MIDGLVPDIMHDILEGTLQLTMNHLIRYLVIEEKLFALPTLNKRIRTFQYGPAEMKNKPSEISQTLLQSDTLKQSGTLSYGHNKKILSVCFSSYSGLVPCWLLSPSGG